MQATPTPYPGGYYSRSNSPIRKVTGTSTDVRLYEYNSTSRLALQPLKRSSNQLPFRVTLTLHTDQLSISRYVGQRKSQAGQRLRKGRG